LLLIVDLTLDDGKYLVNLARKAIYEVPPSRVPDKFKCRRGVFVTLEKDGKLRGCIGFPLPVYSLFEAVIRAARSAAYDDPRFPPLQKDEMVVIEVSVLSKPEPVSVEDIKYGDGVILKKGVHSALFLPQVWKVLPDKSVFLQELAFKAGLNDFIGASFEVFRVIAFKEKEPGGEIMLES